jgi:hypothetical protein
MPIKARGYERTNLILIKGVEPSDEATYFSPMKAASRPTEQDEEEVPSQPQVKLSS